MSIKSGAKIVISSENYKHSLRFFIFHAKFSTFVIRIIQHNLAFSIHLPYSFSSGFLVGSLHFYDMA